ncbi:MAG: hypothetical protein ACPGOV_16345 [Magnetovibrionaceae bacterium]
MSIHNSLVRALVKDNKTHETYEAHWADVQSLDVVARDEQEARAIIEERFPASEGFVIEAIGPTSF